MVKQKLVKRVVDSYSIKGTNKIVKAGDCVMIKPHQKKANPYVARVEKIEAYSRDLKVRLRWYYWPEEAFGGRRKFHGQKELFLSDHYDTQSAQTIEGKCVVHSFKDYTKLPNIGVQDFYCRFEYKPLTRTFSPEHVAVYCKCEMPYNPDDLMIQCEECQEWFHPSCIDMTVEQAKQQKQFICSEHSFYENAKKPTGLVNGKQLEEGPLADRKQLLCTDPSLEKEAKKTTTCTDGKGVQKRQRK